MNPMQPFRHPQVKVCGLTRPDEAQAAADLGVDAIGLVFYPKSPRNVSLEKAAQITAALPPHIKAVGVLVDPTFERVVRIVEDCGLHTVQLHGAETPHLAAELHKATAVRVVKALFASRSPGLADAARYAVDGYLVECGQGRLPGGNAKAWNWSQAKGLAQHHAIALAGGLRPDNVVEAISTCLPDAVDVSSGVETAPGRKDLRRVEQFIARVRSTGQLFANDRKVISPVF